MAMARYSAQTLRTYLRSHRVATMDELTRALGTDVHMTVFRKLRELGYQTSYSHGGRYYALTERIDYDADGLWNHRKIRFSKHGTLVATVEALLEQSESGLTAAELGARLQVGVKETLLRLVRAGRVRRERISARYVYGAADRTRWQRQLRRRQAEETTASRAPAADRVLPDEVRAAIVLYMSLLDERQRRLYAGLESLRAGRGHDRSIATVVGVHPHTVARGRRELLSGQLERGRVRRAGGGRKPVEKKRRR